MIGRRHGFFMIFISLKAAGKAAGQIYRAFPADSSQMTGVPPGVENWISRTGSEAVSIGASSGRFGRTLRARAGRRCAGLELFIGSRGGAAVAAWEPGGAAAGVGTTATWTFEWGTGCR